MSGGRIAVQLDVVTIEDFDENEPTGLPTRELGFLRIVSTSKRLMSLLNEEPPLGDDTPQVNAPIGVGDWVKIKIQFGGTTSFPRVWVLELPNGQPRGDERSENAAEGRVVHLRSLSRGTDTTGASDLGSAITNASSKARKLKRKYSLLNFMPLKSPAQVNHYFRRWGRSWQRSQAWALDAGQASFNFIPAPQGRGPSVFFDVGKPIWSHLHNLPAGFTPPKFKGGFVILSHWDSDHYAYGLDGTLDDKLWFAPAQTSIGPTANSLAQRLHALGRLRLVGTGKSSRHQRGIRLVRCSGTTINGSGLALHQRALGRNLLLTGDADYDLIPSMTGVMLSGLQIPHHGGKMSGTSIIPHGHGQHASAVVSCGVPNRYDHPNGQTLLNHVTANWSVSFTADRPGIPRGNRQF